VHSVLSYFPATAIGWVALAAFIASVVAAAMWARKPSDALGAWVAGALTLLLACFPLLQIARGTPPLRPTPAWLALRLPQTMLGWCLLGAAVVAAVVLMAWAVRRVALRLPALMGEASPGIGIRAGQPKVYDNRSLALMLEGLQEQLTRIQSIKGESVTANLGTQQGRESSSLNISVSPTPAPAETKPAAEAKPATEPTFSERAGDLLEDQVNLSFQIFNLRLMLERALSDRRLDAGKTRLQGVVGIPVSINPPPYAAGCAARVTIRLKATVGAAVHKPSLVALFPQEQTSNFLGVTSRSVDASAPVKIPGFAGNARIQSAGTVSALTRQADVVAYEAEAEGNQTELGLVWEFRPKPGEPSVTPGMKQVMAVISLPIADEVGAEPRIEVTAKSSWHRWDETTRTAGAGLSWRGLLSGRAQSQIQNQFEPVALPGSEALEGELAPKIETIQLLPMGKEEATLVVTGRNFFPGTSVVVGGRVRNKAEDGLLLHSQYGFQVLAKLDELRFGAVLNGRYGPPRTLQVPLQPGIQPPLINTIMVSPDRDKKNTRIEIGLATEQPWPRSFVERLGDPVLLVNGKLAPPPLDIQFIVDGSGANVTSLIARTVVPFDFLPSRTLAFELKWPFYEGWTATGFSHDPTLQVSIYRSAADAATARLTFALEAPYPTPIVVVMDKAYSIATGNLEQPIPDRSDLLELVVAEAVLAGYAHCFVMQDGQLPIALKIPPRQSKPFSVIAGATPQVQAKTGGIVKYTGAGLGAVEEVLVSGKKVAAAALNGGAAMYVFLKKEDIPEAAGLVRVSFRAGSTSESADLLVVETAVTAAL
jgi:hypothetical protein